MLQRDTKYFDLNGYPFPVIAVLGKTSLYPFPPKVYQRLAWAGLFLYAHDDPTRPVVIVRPYPFPVIPELGKRWPKNTLRRCNGCEKNP